MALNKVTILDKVEVVEGGHIQVRHATYVEDNGTRIAGPEYHRQCFPPNDPVGRAYLDEIQCGSPTDRQMPESVRILSTFHPAADKTTTARTKKGTAKKKR